MKVLRRGLGNGALILWTALTVLPFIMILLFSLRNNAGLFAHPLGFGGSYHPDNYAIAWNGPAGFAGMSTFLVNTVIAVATGLLLNLCLGSIAAYYANRLSPRSKMIFMGVFVAAQVVPFVLVLVSYFKVADALSLLNQPFALGFAYAALSMPTTVLVLTAFYADFPKEIAEAAAVDGLGEFSIFLRMVLPLSKGALTGVGMLALVYMWGETQIGIVILQQATSQTVAVGILGFQGQFVTNLGATFAALSLATIPVVVLYLIFNRFVTKGLALGGVSK